MKNLGFGFRKEYFQDLIKGTHPIDWLEITTENYLTHGGKYVHYLETIAQHYPINMHGVSLSIASTSPLDKQYLKKIKILANKINPKIISDHFCWTGMNGKNLHDLYPIPYTQKNINHMVSRIQKVQDILKSQISLENISSYLEFKNNEMSEWDFINQIARKSGCGILLDVNNVYVNSVNHSFNPEEFIKGIDKQHVTQIHLAGHTSTINNGHTLLIDTHDQEICPEVWSLLHQALKKFGAVPTMIERDDNFNSFEIMLKEINQLKSILEQYE